MKQSISQSHQRKFHHMQLLNTSTAQYYHCHLGFDFRVGTPISNQNEEMFQIKIKYSHEPPDEYTLHGL